MPPTLPVFRKTLSLLSLPSRPFVCPSCRYKQARLLSNGSAGLGSVGKRKARGPGLHSRAASTTPSVTAVNAKRDVPPKFQDLHVAFKALETEAAVYVDLSQLRLALRGLESENAVTRVAGILSLITVLPGLCH